MKEEKPESFSVFVAIIPKFQVGSIIFMSMLKGLLNPLFFYLVFHSFIYLFIYIFNIFKFNILILIFNFFDL